MKKMARTTKIKKSIQRQNRKSKKGKTADAKRKMIKVNVSLSNEKDKTGAANRIACWANKKREKRSNKLLSSGFRGLKVATWLHISMPTS